RAHCGERDPAASDSIGERLSIDEFEDDAAGVCRFLQSIDRSDVRMVQGREHFGLATKAPKPFRVARERIWQHFDRDVALQLRIARAIHLAHAARTDLRGNFIRTEASAGGERHREVAGIIGDLAIWPELLLENADVATDVDHSGLPAVPHPRDPHRRAMGPYRPLLAPRMVIGGSLTPLNL